MLAPSRASASTACTRKKLPVLLRQCGCPAPHDVPCRAQFLAMLALSSEFENIAVREEELPELDTLSRSACPVDIKGGAENKHGKVNVLLQVRDAARRRPLACPAPGGRVLLPACRPGCRGSTLEADSQHTLAPPFPCRLQGACILGWQVQQNPILCLPLGV